MFPLARRLSSLRSISSGRLVGLSVVVLAVWILIFGAQNATAQNQENGLLDRINNSDRTLAFPLSNKSFGKTASFKDKEAYIKPYISGKEASFGGDGKFRTKSYGSSAYQAKAYDLRDGLAPGDKAYTQNNKLFNTGAFDVRDARDAGKTAATREFDLHGPFEIKGKRQDTYDELLKRKKLSIDEVRELLNKNK